MGPGQTTRRHQLDSISRPNSVAVVGAFAPSDKEMIQSLKSYPLLTGFRGAKPAHPATIAETLLRVSQHVREYDGIVEMDNNPFIAGAPPGQSKTVDARFIIKIDYSNYFLRAHKS